MVIPVLCFQVFTVETHMLGEVFPGSRAELIEYMETVAGYYHIKENINKYKIDKTSKTVFCLFTASWVLQCIYRIVKGIFYYRVAHKGYDLKDDLHLFI